MISANNFTDRERELLCNAIIQYIDNIDSAIAITPNKDWQTILLLYREEIEALYKKMLEDSNGQ